MAIASVRRPWYPMPSPSRSCGKAARCGGRGCCCCCAKSPRLAAKRLIVKRGWPRTTADSAVPAMRIAMPAMITSEHLPLSITGPTNSRANAAAMEKTKCRSLRRRGWHRDAACAGRRWFHCSSWPMTKQQKVERNDQPESTTSLRMVVLTDIWHENPLLIRICVFYVCKSEM